MPSKSPQNDALHAKVRTHHARTLRQVIRQGQFIGQHLKLLLQGHARYISELSVADAAAVARQAKQVQSLVMAQAICSSKAVELSKLIKELDSVDVDDLHAAFEVEVIVADDTSTTG